MKSEGNYRVVEKLWFFALLMFAGGFYGGYTFSLRGKVFANAQTANLVMMMLSFGNGDWKKGLYAFVPLTAYIVGVCMAEFVSGKMNQKNKSLFEEKLFSLRPLFPLQSVLCRLPYRIVFRRSHSVLSVQCSLLPLDRRRESIWRRLSARRTSGSSG